MLTVKPDWLNDLLAANGAYVSGHPSFARRLEISGAVTLRFLRLKECLLYFLAIEPSRPDYQEEFLAAFDAGRLRELRQQFTPLVQVFYTEGSGEFTLFYPAERTFRAVDFRQMTRLVAGHHDGFRQDAGSGKAINKSINDTFQAWTRECLSQYATANDLDAFTLAGPVPVFVELKRVVQPLADWRPYLDDTANFNSLNLIARQRGGAAITLAYQAGNPTEIACHRGVRPHHRDYIEGRFQLLAPAAVAADLLAVPTRNDIPYTSTRWRKKPDYLK